MIPRLLQTTPRSYLGVRVRTCGVAAVSLLSGTCGSDAIVAVSASETNRSIAAAIGQQIDITLQTIGPGEFASPPAVSTSAVRFLDVRYGGTLPAGTTQRFRFRADSRGTAIITFRHTGFNRTVEDTINVR